MTTLTHFYTVAPLLPYLLLSIQNWGLIVEATELQCFKSRPDLCAPILIVTQHETDHVTPGHIFMTPANVSEGASGPYIYSSSGELVWHGANITKKEVNNFHPCKIAGEEKLCLLDLRHGRGSKASGPALAIDQDLGISEETGLVEIKGGQAYDMHELKAVDDGSAIVTTYYMPRILDLSSLEGPSLGYINACGFQEIDVKSQTINFEWDALDHFDLAESHMEIGSKWGDGQSPGSGWDYFHINSVDKNHKGDYLISSRHTSTIAKISGKNGTVLWRLGGTRSDFTFESGLNFSSQHNVRWQAEDATSAIISLFNNGKDETRQTANSSSGLVLHLNMSTMHTTLMHRYPSPHGSLCPKKGSLQLLPSGNAFILWGNTPNVSEHTSDGTRTIFQAHIEDRDHGIHMYRAWKANFTTSPATGPDVYAVAESKKGPTEWYVSWNGATEVKGWRVYAAQRPADEYQLVGFFRKEGFETRLEAKRFFRWAIIEAVNGDNEGIRNTTAPIHTVHSAYHYTMVDQPWQRNWYQLPIVFVVFIIMCNLARFFFRQLGNRAMRKQIAEL